MNPKEYENASEESGKEFLNPKRSGRVPGEGLDFCHYLPLHRKKKKWKKPDGGCEKYILGQMT